MIDANYLDNVKDALDSIMAIQSNEQIKMLDQLLNGRSDSAGMVGRKGGANC